MSEQVSDKLLRSFFKMIFSLLIICALIYTLLPFIIPIVLGGILAMAFSPFIGYLIQRGNSRRFSLIILTLGLFCIGLAPMMVLLIRGIKVISSFLSEQSLLEIRQNIVSRIDSIIDNFARINDISPVVIREKFNSFVMSSGQYLLNHLSSYITQIPYIILLGLISILSFYFFLSNEEYIRKLYDRCFYFSDKNGDRFIVVLKSCCKEIFISNVLTGLVQASIVGIGSFFCGIGDALVIFGITFCLSFIPVFGAGPFSFTIAIYALLEHRTGAGIGMVIVSLISGIADNIVRPYLAGLGEVKVHGFVTFLAIIGGVFVMGLPGLFVGPLLALLTFGALPIILDDFFPDRNQV